MFLKLLVFGLLQDGEVQGVNGQLQVLQKLQLISFLIQQKMQPLQSDLKM